MATPSTAKRRSQVTLVRPVGDPQTFALPEGATLADLLRAAGAEVLSASITIDGRPIEDFITLKSGMTITIVPAAPAPPSAHSWRETIGMFADDPAFEEVVEAGRAIREADRDAARNQPDVDDS